MQSLVKRSLVLILVAVCVGALAQAQTLSPADLDKAMKHLEMTRQGVIDATAGLSPAQWNFKPAPDKWSVAEVTEHLAAAEDFIRGMIVEKVMVAPAGPSGENVAVIDEMVLKMVPDRSVHRQAPDPLKTYEPVWFARSFPETFHRGEDHNRRLPEEHSWAA